MQLSTYHPNLSDPRVARKVKLAYGFARGCLSPTKPREWAKVYLDKIFGRTNTALGRWLRANLLICSNEHYSFGEDAACKEYVLNQEGADKFRAILKGEAHSLLSSCYSVQQVPADWSQEDLEDYIVVKEFALREHAEELGSLKFKYSDKAGRLWNGLQCIRTKFREQLMAEFDLKHNYDIQACAPTLIHELAMKCGMDEYLFALRGYLADRKAFRLHVANLIGDPTDEEVLKLAKTLINSFFCGAKLGNNPEYSLYHLLKGDFHVIRRLQQDEQVKALRADIKTCWDAIEPTMWVAYKKDKNGRNRKVALSSRRKWGVYFQLERTILDAVLVYLQKTDNKCFLEHDGWRTQKAVQVDELIEHVLQVTGFAIKVDYEEAHFLSSSCYSVQQVPETDFTTLQKTPTDLQPRPKVNWKTALHPVALLGT